MPIGGRLTLKGGLVVSKSGVEKKKTKKKKTKDGGDKKEEEEGAATTKGISVMSNKTYEEEFSMEMSRAKTGKERSTPWGTGFRKAPEILHGYQQKVKGKTAEERLDMRSGRLMMKLVFLKGLFGFVKYSPGLLSFLSLVAMKSDKFCK